MPECDGHGAGSQNPDHPPTGADMDIETPYVPRETSDQEDEAAWQAEHGRPADNDCPEPMDTLQGLYDEDRSVTITGKNGEISIRVGNQEPIVVPAVAFSEVSLTAIVEASR